MTTTRGVQISLQQVDTNGADDYAKLRPLCYPGVNVVLLCFSLVDATTFDNITTKWLPEISQHCPDVPIILVGFKADLRFDPQSLQQFIATGQRVVESDQIKEFMSQNCLDVYAYKECSALQQTNIGETMQLAIDLAYEHHAQRWKNKNKNTNNDKKCTLM